MNKKGIELTFNTIITAILAIIVLVILVLIFTGTAGKVLSYFSSIAKDVLGLAEATQVK
ncbi:MAG: hypothetical protein AB1571_04280 [Nanoarchaeota archaeon]